MSALDYLGEGFSYRQDVLYCEEVELSRVAAAVGTPTFVYSSLGILARYRAYDEAFGAAPHQVCYAVKANSNLSVLRLLAEAGSSFDIVSGGELFRVLKAGGKASRVVFSGVGKTAAEIEYALNEGIGCFNCESETELALIDACASRLGKRARCAIRVNPDIDPKTHPYISTGLKDNKFGIDINEVEDVYRRALNLRNVEMAGVSCHIGSQMLDSTPITEAVDRMIALTESLRALGAPIEHLDFGGGIGIPYRDADRMPSIAATIEGLCARAAKLGLELHVEPGRSITGSAGVLLTRVLNRKTTQAKEFVVIDAAMNDLLRPTLYKAHHEIVPLRRIPAMGYVEADVVGPVCESGDYIAQNRRLANVMPGDTLAVCSAGAYGFVMSSNYNSRPRAAEVLVEGASFRTVRERETLEDLVRGE
ncbi:MAG: diaminopimelate decarboxylase [Acidobacteria bacterium]|nr:diaminopimelate decarboxylase [Acidobacteriota bacterium]